MLAQTASWTAATERSATLPTRPPAAPPSVRSTSAWRLWAAAASTAIVSTVAACARAGGRGPSAMSRARRSAAPRGARRTVSAPLLWRWPPPTGCMCMAGFECHACSSYGCGTLMVRATLPCALTLLKQGGARPAVHVRIRGAYDGLRPDSRRALLLRLRHGLLRSFCPRPGASVPCLAQARRGKSVWHMAPLQLCPHYSRTLPSFVPLLCSMRVRMQQNGQASPPGAAVQLVFRAP